MTQEKMQSILDWLDSEEGQLREKLTENENIIFYNKTTEINNLITKL